MARIRAELEHAVAAVKGQEAANELDVLLTEWRKKWSGTSIISRHSVELERGNV